MILFDKVYWATKIKHGERNINNIFRANGLALEEVSIKDGSHLRKVIIEVYSDFCCLVCGSDQVRHKPGCRDTDDG